MFCHEHSRVGLQMTLCNSLHVVDMTRDTSHVTYIMCLSVWYHSQRTSSELKWVTAMQEPTAIVLLHYTRSVCDHIVALFDIWSLLYAVVVLDVGIHGNHLSSRAPAVRPYGFNPPHVYAVSYTRRPQVTSSANQPLPADVTSSRRPDSLPRDERHVTFADDSSVLMGDGDVCGREDDQNVAGTGGSSRYGSSEFSDVTSVTSGSYYMDEDSHHQPVSFILV